MPRSNPLAFQEQLSDGDVQALLCFREQEAMRRKTQAWRDERKRRLKEAFLDRRVQNKEGASARTGTTSSGRRKTLEEEDEDEEDCRLPDEEDVCPICHDELMVASSTSKCSAKNSTVAEQLVWCEGSCRQAMHVTCMQKWSAHKMSTGDIVSCPLCRHAWTEEQLLTLKKMKARADTKLPKHPCFCRRCKVRPIRGALYACLVCTSGGGGAQEKQACSGAPTPIGGGTTTSSSSTQPPPLRASGAEITKNEVPFAFCEECFYHPMRVPHNPRHPFVKQPFPRATLVAAEDPFAARAGWRSNADAPGREGGGAGGASGDAEDLPFWNVLCETLCVNEPSLEQWRAAGAARQAELVRERGAGRLERDSKNLEDLMPVSTKMRIAEGRPAERPSGGAVTESAAATSGGRARKGSFASRPGPAETSSVFAKTGRTAADQSSSGGELPGPPRCCFYPTLTDEENGGSTMRCVVVQPPNSNNRPRNFRLLRLRCGHTGHAECFAELRQLHCKTCGTAVFPALALLAPTAAAAPRGEQGQGPPDNASASTAAAASVEGRGAAAPPALAAEDREQRLASTGELDALVVGGTAAAIDVLQLNAAHRAPGAAAAPRAAAEVRGGGNGTLAVATGRGGGRFSTRRPRNSLLRAPELSLTGTHMRRSMGGAEDGTPGALQEESSMVLSGGTTATIRAKGRDEDGPVGGRGRAKGTRTLRSGVVPDPPFASSLTPEELDGLSVTGALVGGLAAGGGAGRWTGGESDGRSRGFDKQTVERGVVRRPSVGRRKGALLVGGSSVRNDPQGVAADGGVRADSDVTTTRGDGAVEELNLEGNSMVIH